MKPNIASSSGTRIQIELLQQIIYGVRYIVSIYLIQQLN